MSWLGPFLLLLGPLVVIHELGHFLVAKLFGVKCERFAVGFGPPIFRYRLGETEYVLAWFPLGGYVKMLGDSPDEPLPPEDVGRSFSGQSPLRRTLIALAGPAANLFLSVAVIAGVLMTTGWPTLAAKVGRVLPDSPAAAAGLQHGDRILAVDGQEIERWTDLQERVVGSGGEPVEVVVERRGERVQLLVDPEIDEASGMPMIGVSPGRENPILVFAGDDAPGARAGLASGDRVVSVAGTPIGDAQELASRLGELDAGQPLELVVARPEPEAPEGREVAVTVPPPGENDGEDGAWSPERLGALDVDFAIAGMLIGSPAGKAGLEPGDIFVTVGGERVTSYAQVEERIQASRGEPLKVEALRGAKVIQTEVVPRKALGLPPDAPEQWELGIVATAPMQPGEQIDVRIANPLLALQRGVTETWALFVATADGVRKLVTREVGMDAVAGPIGIGQIAADAFNEPGWFMFLRIMALISVNLAIINLLPVPILDGGHILFAAAEAISGGPLGVRARELAQAAGLSFIVVLMGFAFWNDIARNWQSITSFFENLAQ